MTREDLFYSILFILIFMFMGYYMTTPDFEDAVMRRERMR